MANNSGSGLSAEQLRRMEENRRKAKERLSNKRTAPVTKTTPMTQPSHCPPPSKRPALLTDSVQSRGEPTNNVPSSTHAHYQEPSRFKSHLKSQTSSISTPSFSFSLSTSAPVNNTNTQQHFNHNPSSLSSVRNAPETAITSYHSTHTQPLLSSSTKTFLASSSTQLSRSHHPPGPSSVSRQQKFVEMQKKRIKANLTLVSKTRFKVFIPYESNVIEIFKRMSTRSYDAKTGTWSFGIEDYSRLVDTLKRDCKYVDLSLIPKPVVNLFHSKRMSDSKTTTTTSTTCSSIDPPPTTVDWSKIDSKLSSTLMQFQRDGVEFSIKHGGRVLIADDMGLGKTLQSIAVMCHYRSDWPLLVICPSSVRLTWAEAFKRWLPSLRECDINVVLATKTLAAAMDGAVNIISYDLLVKMAKEIQEKRFMAVISDESHFLKNYKTVRCKSALPILKTARRCILLSGTPALSRPIELYTQITVLDKNFSRSVSLVDFGLRYCNGVKNHFGWDFSGASNMTELQLYMEEAIMIRRFKTDVLDQLPSKQRQMVLLDPSLTKGKSQEVREMKEEINKAGKLKRLDQRSALLPLFEKTGRMKLPAVRDYIIDLLEGDRKVIVFGHHKSVLNGVCESLDNKGFGYIRIDGRTPAELRQTYCDQFQHDEKCLVAVLSITTANAGLTLTAASIVVFAELFWNPGILVQAEDRAYRIGQKSSVNVHYLVAKDTADDFIWPLIQNKLDVLSQAGLTKDDFSQADSKLLKDATQKNLFQCFGDLISEADVQQLDNKEEDLDDKPKITQSHDLSRDHQSTSGSAKGAVKTDSVSRHSRCFDSDDPDFVKMSGNRKRGQFKPPFKPPTVTNRGQRSIQTRLTGLTSGGKGTCKDPPGNDDGLNSSQWFDCLGNDELLSLEQFDNS